MRISVKCSSAVHALLMIAVLPDNVKKTSEFLASSVGCNPVEMRRIFCSLKKAGIIEVTRGPGGTKLLKKPEDISLLEIYSAVDSTSISELIGVHANPAEQCPFGKNIVDVLSEPYDRVCDAVRREMAEIKLTDFLERLKEAEPGLFEKITV